MNYMLINSNDSWASLDALNAIDKRTNREKWQKVSDVVKDTMETELANVDLSSNSLYNNKILSTYAKLNLSHKSLED